MLCRTALNVQIPPKTLHDVKSKAEVRSMEDHRREAAGRVLSRLLGRNVLILMKQLEFKTKCLRLGAYI